MGFEGTNTGAVASARLSTALVGEGSGMRKRCLLRQRCMKIMHEEELAPRGLFAPPLATRKHTHTDCRRELEDRKVSAEENT